MVESDSSGFFRQTVLTWFYGSYMVKGKRVCLLDFVDDTPLRKSLNVTFEIGEELSIQAILANYA